MKYVYLWGGALFIPSLLSEFHTITERGDEGSWNNFDENFKNSSKSCVNILDKKFPKDPVLCCLPLGKLKGPTFEEKVFATLKTSLRSVIDHIWIKIYAMEKIFIKMHCMHTRVNMFIKQIYNECTNH